METKRVHQLAIMALAHRLAAEELRFDGMRSKLGEFARRYGFELKDVERFAEEFFDLMHIRYVQGSQWDERKSDQFATIGLLMFLHLCATEGIKFSGLSRRLGQFCQMFKIERDECNEFMREILHLLHEHYVRAPKHAEIEWLDTGLLARQ